MILSILAIFIFFLFPFTDADIGWHLKYGEYFWQNLAILKTNTFSWIMPQFIWGNHSWGFDVIIYGLYKNFDFIGLTIAASILITLSYYLVRPKNSFTIVPVVITTFFGTHLLNLGFRSQLFSLLFFCLIWHLLNQYTQTQKTKYLFFLPPAFLLWSNLHGQYLLGLGIVALYIFGLLFQVKRPKISYLLYSLFISFCITVINPFGLNLLKTSFAHLTSPLLQYIYEWMSWEWGTPRLYLLILYILVYWLFYLKKRTLNSGQLFVLIFLTIFSLKSRRFIPLFIFYSLESFSNFLNIQSKKLNYILLTLFILFTSFFLLPQRNLLHQSWDNYCITSVRCSEKALEYIRSNNIQGTLFNGYSLGGWLIWRYPNLKPFIDGRMTLWQDPGSKSYPFATYLTMVHAQKGFQNLFLNFNFDYVLIQPQFELSSVLKDQYHWPILYEDEYLVLYQNPKNVIPL